MRQLIGVLEDQVPDPPDDAPALGRRHPAPRAVLERPARRPHGPVDVFGATLGDPGERLARRWVGRLERLARRGVGPLPVDEQLTRRADEGFDIPVQGHSHKLVHLPWLRGGGSHRLRPASTSYAHVYIVDLRYQSTSWNRGAVIW